MLDTVLQKGADLQRAANCVMIANEPHNRTDTIDHEILDAKRTAGEYENTTNTLITKISTVLLAQR